MIALIVVCAVPHGTKYVGTFTSNNIETKMEYIFKGNKLTVNYKMFKDGEDVTSEYVPENTEMEYTIIDGKLYEGADRNADNITEVEKATAPTINSFKIVVKNGDETSELKCVANIAVLAVSIVFLVLGAAGLATSITLVCLDKKKKSA